MANVWQEFVILRLGELPRVGKARPQKAAHCGASFLGHARAACVRARMPTGH